MNTDIVRLYITLPGELARTLNELAGPRKRSQFIADAIRARIKQMKKIELDRVLEEGYRAVAKEDLALGKEFETADLEGWDEY